MRVWYPGSTPRTTGLRLVPGWNDLPISNALLLIERGIVTQEGPGTAEEATEAPKEDEEPKAGTRKKWRTARRIIE